MIIVLKQNTKPEQLENLEAWIHSMGIETHVSIGKTHTIIGLVGDTSQVDMDLVRALDIVENVKRIQEPFKNANRKFHNEDLVVDIGGGTTGIAIVKQGRVTYSADEATGGHHISLTLAGNRGIGLEEAEQYKRRHAGEIWPVVKPVYEKMAEIVARHITGQGIGDLWLAGGACMQPGVRALFCQCFPTLKVHLPRHSLFMTPLAIANSGREKAEGIYAS